MVLKISMASPHMPEPAQIYKEPLLSALSNYLKVQQFGLLYGTRQATLYYFDWLSLGLLRQQKFRAAWHAIERKPNGHTLHILYIL